MELIKAMDFIRYDPSAVLLDGTGLSETDLNNAIPRIEAARVEVLDDAKLWESGAAAVADKTPAEKLPLDAGFIDLPQRLLDEYDRNGDASELGRILAASDKLRKLVDRVVILGIGGSYMGARALFEACCHPYHNELTRSARTPPSQPPVPKIYFEGNNVDNDATRGLLELLEQRTSANTAENRWAIVVISKSGGTLETSVAFRIFRDALTTACGDEAEDSLPKLIVPITGEQGRLRDLSASMHCETVFDIPEGVGGRFSILTAVGLLPAAIMGLDVAPMLEGAAAVTRRFRETPLGDNPVLDYTRACHLLETKRGITIRVLSAWAKGLEATGLWYDQLLSESLGKIKQNPDGPVQRFGATPITVLNTRDLHSRGQQHQQGRRDKLITNLIVDQIRGDPLRVGDSELNDDRLNELADKALPDIMAAAIAGTNQAYRDDGRPTADLHLPRLDEASLGQLFQMLMLATVVEGRLLGVNPYGQPGVEAYKTNMNAILREQ